MGTKHGNDAVVKLGAGATDVSAYVTAIHMSLKGHGLVDVTTMGAIGHKWASDSLLDDSFTIDFLFDTTLASMFNELASFRSAEEAIAIVISPYGEDTGSLKITGNGWMEDLPMEVAIGDMIRLTGVPFRFDNGAQISIN